MQGLAGELSKEGACDRAIFPDTNIVVDRCAMIGNLSKEGVSFRRKTCFILLFFSMFDLCMNSMNETSFLQGDRCSLDWVPGCMDPTSHLYNPLANVDDGSCPIDSDVED